MAMGANIIAMREATGFGVTLDNWGDRLVDTDSYVLLSASRPLALLISSFFLFWLLLLPSVDLVLRDGAKVKSVSSSTHSDSLKQQPWYHHGAGHLFICLQICTIFIRVDSFLTYRTRFASVRNCTNDNSREGTHFLPSSGCFCSTQYCELQPFDWLRLLFLSLSLSLSVCVCVCVYIFLFFCLSCTHTHTVTSHRFIVLANYVERLQPGEFGIARPWCVVT